ncbi:MAG TPA: dipeptide ABC transporter ATP-binding protein [Planctomycetes bacterium]|nr:dipeptide ABC transporter ATP-binding protein [Planctomycetota bacterium]
MTDNDSPLLEVKDLRTWFPIRSGVFSRVTAHVKAVDGVSFQLGRRETLGLVGESGCGKTTVGRSILRLVEPTSGKVTFDGQDVGSTEGAEMRKLRKRMQIIFQDPYGSLNPRMTVGSILSEGPRIHQMGSESQIRDRIEHLMQRCGLDPLHHINRYPHEFSGGQRQRIGIARALSVEPEFIVCDEAVSALDVSIQAQIINLLLDLQEEFDLSYLFIAHDLAVVEHISDRVAVMYLGKIVEEASSEQLYNDPRHPYTQALLSAVPGTKPGQSKDRILLEGDVPSPIDPPPGCSFHTRCPRVGPRCSVEAPAAFRIAAGHCSYCWLEDAAGVEGTKVPS